MISIVEKHLKSINFGDIEEYIYFCKNNSTSKEKFKTEEHHILPSKVFPEYSNLKEHPWNGVHLTHENHYIAHSILHKNCDNISFASAWAAMNYMNTKNGRITNPENILGAGLFSELREKRNKGISKHKKAEKILDDGTISSIAKEAGKKISKKRLKIDIETGKTMASIYNSKSAIKRKERTIDSVTGEETSISLRAAKKAAVTTKTKKIILENGEEVTLKENIKRNKAKTDLKNSRRFMLCNVFNNHERILLRREIISLNQGLLKSTKENYMGKHHKSKANLIKKNQEELYGSYIIEEFQ